MKKIIVIFAFTLYSFGLPLWMAHATAQDSSTQAVTVAVESDSLDSEIIESLGQMEVNIEGVSKEQEEKIRKLFKGLVKLFGDDIKAELEIELGELSDAEKEELLEKIDNFREGNHLSIDTDGIGAGEALVAITAICLTLGLPVIILLLVFIFGHKKRRQMIDLADLYVKAEQPLPQHLVAEFGKASPDQRLRSGIQLVFVGLAIVIAIGALAGAPGTLGFIPMAIGLSRLLYWRYESKQARHNEAPESDLTTNQ